MDNRYITVKGLAELENIIKQDIDKVKSLSAAKSMHAAPKPDLPLRLLDYTKGIAHAYIAYRVDKGEVSIRRYDVTEHRHFSPDADELKLYEKLVVQSRKQPLAEGELSKYVHEFNPVDKKAQIEWQMAPVAERPLNPPGYDARPQAERIVEARNFVEATPAKQLEVGITQTIAPTNTAGG